MTSTPSGACYCFLIVLSTVILLCFYHYKNKCNDLQLTDCLFRMSLNTLFETSIPFQGPPLDQVIVAHFNDKVSDLSEEVDSVIEESYDAAVPWVFDWVSSASELFPGIKREPNNISSTT